MPDTDHSAFEPSASVELLDHETREGVLRMRLLHHGAGPPPVRVTHRTETLAADLAPEPEPGIWRLKVQLPPAVVSEGVQTLLVSMPDGTAIGAAQLIVGQPASAAAEAQIDLLRQEVALLKRVVRRIARRAEG